MKKTVLTFGLISGGMSAVMMLFTLSAMERVGFRKAELLGYTSIVLAALLVFFGIRSYRENVGGGRITFGRGLGVGVTISLISAACYVAMFQVVYFKLNPDFGDKLVAAMVDHARQSGAGPQKIEEAVKQAQMFKRLYDQPLANAALTFVEPFPIGLVVSLISAAILRKSQAPPVGQATGPRRSSSSGP